MGDPRSLDLVRMLENAGHEIELLMLDSQREIEVAGAEFEKIARQTDEIMRLAADVIDRVGGESVRSILPKVRSLGDEAKRFVRERIEAASGVLGTVAAESDLLDRLRQLTLGQRSIARETQVLSVLTNIEVARLDRLGEGFQYLARQLDEFSQSVAKGTNELAARAAERKIAIVETRRTLVAALPSIQKQLTQIEAGLGNAQVAVDSGIARLSQVPIQFRSCFEEIAEQVAGVVAAIQAHDITRQQLEHVHAGIRLIAAKLLVTSGSPDAGAEESARIAAGLAIQAYQLQSIRQTMSNWVTQIRSCTGGILKIGCTEVLGIGPMVLDQERGLSAELARIGAFEQECQVESAEVLEMFASLNTLTELVREHVVRSRAVRERLQLLTFNSIVEATRLGAKADAILEISRSIKRISIAWGDITDRSASAMEEMSGLTDHAARAMKAYSQTGREGLAAAQIETGEALESLRTSAAFVATQSVQIEEAVGMLKSKIAAAAGGADRLDACAGRLDAALNWIEEVKAAVESENSAEVRHVNVAEMESIYGDMYTTATEREVLRAALSGAPLPAREQNLAGNDVELF